MIFDIDNINNNFKFMNILQLKWMLYIQIQKNIFNQKLINQMQINKMILKQFINL